MKKLEQIYEGKAKKVYATDDPKIVIVDYKDDATAFNGLKKGTIAGKGVVKTRYPTTFSAYWRRRVSRRTMSSSFPIAKQPCAAWRFCPSR